MEGEVLAVLTDQLSPNVPSAASCGFEHKFTQLLSTPHVPVWKVGNLQGLTSWLKGEMLGLTVQVGFDSRSKIRPFLTFPCSREGNSAIGFKLRFDAVFCSEEHATLSCLDFISIFSVH